MHAFNNVTRNTRLRVSGERWAPATFLFVVCLLAIAGSSIAAPATIQSAAAPQAASPSTQGNDKQPSPEEKMRARFPQFVLVGDLIGLPVLDYDDSTIGYVHDVVRSRDGKIALIVPYGRWLGWARLDAIFNRWRRPVAVPVEAVAILARQLDVLDMSRDDIDKAETWTPAQGEPVRPDEQILIALGRR